MFSSNLLGFGSKPKAEELPPPTDQEQQEQPTYSREQTEQHDGAAQHDDEEDDRRISAPTAQIFAHDLYERYSTTHEPLKTTQVGDLIRHLYKSLGIGEEPSQELIQDFIIANDQNGDGKFDLFDLQSLLIDHLSTGTDQGFTINELQEPPKSEE